MLLLAGVAILAALDRSLRRRNTKRISEHGGSQWHSKGNRCSSGTLAVIQLSVALSLPSAALLGLAARAIFVSARGPPSSRCRRPLARPRFPARPPPATGAADRSRFPSTGAIDRGIERGRACSCSRCAWCRCSRSPRQPCGMGLHRCRWPPMSGLSAWLQSVLPGAASLCERRTQTHRLCRFQCRPAVAAGVDLLRIARVVSARCPTFRGLPADATLGPPATDS